MALALLEKGLSKDNVFAQTGLTVGVQGAEFTVKEGEVFVIMGLSGSGKSTLVRLLNRLIEPTTGEVWLGKRNISQANKAELRHIRRKYMSMVFQSFALFPHYSVWKNVAFGLEVAGVSKGERKRRALETLDQVGLASYAYHRPAQLSGGMQQRVGLARALANDPEILLMDEAFSALDPLIRSEMQDELLKLQSKKKRTIIFISHDLDEAMKIGDRIAIMEGGRIIQIGTPEELLNNPANDYVKSFFESVDVTHLITCGEVAEKTEDKVLLVDDYNTDKAFQYLDEKGYNYAFLVDGTHMYKGIIDLHSLKKGISQGKSLENSVCDAGISLQASDAVLTRLKEVAGSRYPAAVVDSSGKYLGAVSKSALLNKLAEVKS